MVANDVKGKIVTDPIDRSGSATEIMLTVACDGATDEQIGRAIAAARAVFAGTGATPLDGAVAAHKLESWELAENYEMPAMSSFEAMAAELWYTAHEVAENICNPERDPARVVDLSIPQEQVRGLWWYVRRK